MKLSLSARFKGLACQPTLKGLKMDILEILEIEFEEILMRNEKLQSNFEQAEKIAHKIIELLG
jgi:hypothetical protein